MRICTITGSRAEFFLLKDLIIKLEKDRSFDHKLLVTGSHNLKILGKTIDQIKKSNIKIDGKANFNLKKDKPKDIAIEFAKT